MLNSGAIFTPDTFLASEVVPSPNHGERRDGRRPDMIVLHYTGMASAQAALQALCSEDSEVSAHYFVFEDGRIVQSVPEARRAWHAGEGSWEDDTDINSCSIGIEIANPGHEFGYPDFPRRQIAAMIALCRSIVKRYDIRVDRVVAHSDTAPSRKKDPGEKFPWQLLFDSGIGLWVEPAAITGDMRIAFGETSEAVMTLQAALKKCGYGIKPTGTFDETTRDVVTAFQRHFRPERVDGIADTSTLDTIGHLLSLRAAFKTYQQPLPEPPASAGA
jgi:N-acetylmuramoyl-L-alanine amidase